MRKKLLSMLVLLTAAAPGAWAQDEVTLTPQGESAWTLQMPASNVELEVTYFTQAELDQQTAEDVVTLINAIGEVAYTEECKARIDAARAAYDALTDDQKALITAEQLAVLTAAEAAYEALKPIEFTWDAATNTGTLRMPASDVELEIEYKADLTLTVSIEGWTYGATASAPTVSGNEGNGAVTYEYKVKDAADDTYTADVPTAAGDYTVRATVAETDDYADATATTDFTIQKAAATISYETASVSKTFGDADFTNDLTNTGDGILTYASDNEDVATVDDETGQVHIVGAGEATIYATVSDGDNYTYATKTAQYAIGVNTAAMSVTATNYTGTYDGESHTVSVTVTEPEGTTVKYGTEEGQYTLDTAPTYTDAGTYTVYYQVTKPNYTTVTGAAIVTISQAAGVISFAESSMSKTYGDADFTNELTNNGDGIVTYASDNTAIATVDDETGIVTITGAPGQATIYATVTDGTNYAYATKTATFTVGVETAAITVSAQGFTGTYDGESHTVSVTVTEPEGTTVKYGTTEGQYTLDAAPAYTDAGEYTVYYQVTKPNYTTVENSAVVSIAKAAAAISYPESTLTKTQDEEPFIFVLTRTGDGIVTYASDNVNVAVVDSETGLVTITGTGTATIKATVADGTNYTYATKTAQYTLTVTAATGIKAIDNGQPATDSTEEWYDLSGRRVSKPTKGVFILNGKKVVIK